MKNELYNLVNYLNCVNSSSFTEATLNAELPTIFHFLLNKDVIVPANPAKMAKCKECDHDHFEQVVKMEGKYYIKCEYSEYASITTVQPEELISYRFNLNSFLTWLSNEFKVSAEIKPLSDITWFIATNKGKDIYFIKSSQLEETLNYADKIRTDEKIIIWLGEIPMEGFVRHNLLSLRGILGIKDTNLTAKLTQRSLQTLKKTIPDKDSITLDTHILISSNKLWLYKNGMGFEKEISIRNDCFRIVRYLYDTRNSGIYLKASELSDKLDIKPINAIQTRIAEVNKICRESNLKEVIVSHINKTWVLNPTLDCFKTSPK